LVGLVFAETKTWNGFYPHSSPQPQIFLNQVDTYNYDNPSFDPQSLEIFQQIFVIFFNFGHCSNVAQFLLKNLATITSTFTFEQSLNGP
jgi:hypothetical protein